MGKEVTIIEGSRVVSALFFDETKHWCMLIHSRVLNLIHTWRMGWDLGMSTSTVDKLLTVLHRMTRLRISYLSSAGFNSNAD